MMLGKFRRAGGGVLAVALVLAGQAHADFVDDLAQCAKAPIKAATDVPDPEKALIAAQFAIDHGQCIPRVVAVDPLLVGMSVGIAGMQSQNILPSDADGCIDKSIGAASKPVAGALDYALANAPGGGAILSSEARALLRDIAEGESNKTLFQIPGFAMVAEAVTCGCAVASSGLPVEELKEQTAIVLESVEGCTKVVGALLGGAYEIGASAAGAVNEAAAKIYGSAVDTVNAIGCELGLGGCDDEPAGPPFFCVGYENIRAQGHSAEAILSNYSWMWKDSGFPSAQNPFAPKTYDELLGLVPSKAAQDAIDAKNKEVDSWFAGCEISYQAKVAAEIKRKAEEAEKKRILAEVEKAEQLGSSYALRFAFEWSPKCKKDAQCEKGVSLIADQFNAEIKDPDTIQQYGTFGAAAEAIYKKYSSNAGVAVAFAEARRKKAIKADPAASKEDRLWAFDCSSFLGRDAQSICRNVEGFDVCKSYVKKDQHALCALGGADSKFFAKAGVASSNLKSAGCIAQSQSRTSTTLQCVTPLARERCEAFGRGGSPVACAHKQEAAKRKLNDVLKAIQHPPPARQPAPTTPADPSRRAPATPSAPAEPPPTLPTIRRLPPVAPPAEEPPAEDEAPRG